MAGEPQGPVTPVTQGQPAVTQVPPAVTQGPLGPPEVWKPHVLGPPMPLFWLVTAPYSGKLHINTLEIFTKYSHIKLNISITIFL